MPAVLKLGSEEIKNLIGQLTEQEKLDIYKSLRKSFLKSQYLEIADSKKDILVRTTSRRLSRLSDRGHAPPRSNRHQHPYQPVHQ